MGSEVWTSFQSEFGLDVDAWRGDSAKPQGTSGRLEIGFLTFLEEDALQE